MTAVVVALAVAVLLLAVLVAGLLRSHAEILKALHELGAGLELDKAGGPVDVTIDGVRAPRRAAPRAGPAETADAVTGESLTGEAVALSLTSGRDTLLAFLSSGCLTCSGFWEAFADESLAVPGDARLVVVTRSLDEESGSALASRAPRHLPVVASSSAWEGFGVPGSPYFVYLDGTGRVVGEGSAATWPAVDALMAQAHADDAHRQSRTRRRSSRADRDDAALAASGIRPGDPSL